MFQTKFVEKIKTHILCSVTFYRKSYRLWDNVGKILYSQTGHRWQYRVIHKSVKHFKNSQQIDYATDHGNSYVDIERNCLSFFKEKPAHVVPMICR